MQSEKIILISISTDQLQDLIKDAVRSELSKKKEKEILNSKEICEFLNIHPSTLSAWKRENKIPFSKIGKRVFFKRQDVINSLKDSKYYKLKQLQIR